MRRLKLCFAEVLPLPVLHAAPAHLCLLGRKTIGCRAKRFATLSILGINCYENADDRLLEALKGSDHCLAKIGKLPPQRLHVLVGVVFREHDVLDLVSQEPLSFHVIEKSDETAL